MSSKIAALEAQVARLQEENAGLAAKLCCTEGWGKSLTAALAENERLTAFFDEAVNTLEKRNAEIARLTAERANRYWEGRWRDEKAQNERLTKLLKAAAYHVEDAGDVSLLHDVREALGQVPA